MWTDTTRAQYARTDLALPTDLTDVEWTVLEPFFPLPSQVGRCGGSASGATPLSSHDCQQKWQ